MEGREPVSDGEMGVDMERGRAGAFLSGTKGGGECWWRKTGGGMRSL